MFIGTPIDDTIANLAAGAKGKRFSLPNSRIVIHQPLMSGLAGQATDIDIGAREILRMRDRLNDILVHRTGQPLKRIQEDTEPDDRGDARRPAEGPRARRGMRRVCHPGRTL